MVAAEQGALDDTLSPMISFVITSRDEDSDLLRRTVDGLRATSPSAEREIVVIDDGSVSPVGGLGPDVHLVRNAEPAGVSRARRQAMAIARGEVLVCLDAHMTFDPDWLTRMLDHVESGALLCGAYGNYERTEVGCYGADFEWVGRRDYESGLSPGFRPRHRRSDPGPGAHEVPMVLGACYMLLRSSYDALGGFSPLFRVWGVDEQDLSARAWLAGLRVACVADARVGHLTRAAAPYQVVFDHIEYNQLAFLLSVFDFRTIDSLLPSFDPLPALVPDWLAEADVAGWRAMVQRRRRLSDEEFFHTVVREMALPNASATLRAATSIIRNP